MSNVFHYLSISDALRIRLASKKLDEACLIGMNINLHEIRDQVDKYLFVIATNWSSASKAEHQELRQEEMSINELLRKFIEEAAKPSKKLGNKCFNQVACHLVRPNHLLIKPIFAVLILQQKFVPGPYPSDWKDYPELHKIWAKVKKQIKGRDFFDSLKTFDIRTVRQQDIDLIAEMYRGDKWMSGEMVTRHKGIAAEGKFSAAMFKWVNKIIEFVKVAKKLNRIGIYKIEFKIEKLKNHKAKITELL